jgi:small subunit ribosomal protein S4e
MAKRGIYHHLKRLNAPHKWLLSKVGGIYATKPSQGPHKLRSCMPLIVLLRNKLKLALNAREAKLIVKAKEGNIAIDGKVRKDPKFPIGCMDVVSLLKANVDYRVLYDAKGRFGLVKIGKDEAQYKLCKVKNKMMGPKKVPYIVTDDGRTLRYPNPEIKKYDSIKLNLDSNEITGIYKYKIGAQVIIDGGNNIGRVGEIVNIEKHPGSYEIVYIKDTEGKVFSTRLTNIFITGDQKSEIPIEKYNTLMSIIEERKYKGVKVLNEEGESQ